MLKQFAEQEDDMYKYRLVGVVIHAGTGQHGHYYSFANTNREEGDFDPSDPNWASLQKGKWKKFDDRDVTVYQVSDMNLDAFGGSSDGYEGGNDFANIDDNWGKSAYMLVYERSKKKALECVDSADSRAVEWQTVQQ